MPPEFDEYDLEILIAKITAFAAALPPLVAAGLEHYRWHVKRRDKRVKSEFQRYVKRAVARAMAEHEGGDE